MKKCLLFIVFIFSSVALYAQTQTQPSALFAPRQTPLSREEMEARMELHFGELEEIAMCHHAIKAAKHDGLALHQNPYYRYIVYAPQKGHGSNVYPVPERCRTIETRWVLDYTQEDKPEFKAMQEKSIQGLIQMTIPEISADAQFLTVVINKMEIEGDQAIYMENMDKHIPQ